jgi:uncharacterized repeat protein (TIGR03803 family)
VNRFSPLQAWSVILFAAIFVTLFCAVPAAAQSYHVLYTFTGGADGDAPAAGVTMDAAGNLYGTAANGGALNYGTAFKLSHRGSGWVFATLHAFNGNDGKYPGTRVVIGPSGGLYGTASLGGTGCGGEGCGVIYGLNPPATFCPTVSCPWNSHVVHFFSNLGTDGYSPYSEVTFDQHGKMYGTTYAGGVDGFGTVYEFDQSGSGGVIYSFTGGNEGLSPEAPVTVDTAGDLYGTSTAGFTNSGSAFELAHTQSGFQLNVLHQFQSSTVPVGGLVFDTHGNLYGTTSGGGSHNGGIVYELAGGSNFSVVWNISGFSGGGPTTSLVMDALGNLYGVNPYNGASGFGSVFRLSLVGGTWNYTDLYDFTGGPDGGYPYGPVAVDAQGDIFGTALEGGSGCPQRSGCGVIWEITPLRLYAPTFISLRISSTVAMARVISSSVL